MLYYGRVPLMRKIQNMQAPQTQKSIAVIDSKSQVTKGDLLEVLADMKKIIKEAIQALSKPLAPKKTDKVRAKSSKNNRRT